jgi:hypothetical protein
MASILTIPEEAAKLNQLGAEMTESTKGDLKKLF